VRAGRTASVSGGGRRVLGSGQEARDLKPISRFGTIREIEAREVRFFATQFIPQGILVNTLQAHNDRSQGE
jgi:hypothetical protein